MSNFEVAEPILNSPFDDPLDSGDHDLEPQRRAPDAPAQVAVREENSNLFPIFFKA